MDRRVSRPPRRTVLLQPLPAATVIVLSGALTWTAGAASATPDSEPVSVGDRFYAHNRAQPVTVDGWRLWPTALLQAGYDDNITLTRGAGPSSSELGLRGTIDAERAVGQYVLNTHASLGQVWYPDAPRNDETDVDVGGLVAYGVKEQLRLHGALAFQQDTDRSVDNGIFVDGAFDPYTTRATYRRVPFEAGFEHQGPVLGLLGRAQIAAVEFDSLATQSGLVIDQDFRSGWEGELSFRSGFRVTPGASLFAETAAGTRRYRDSQADRDTWRIAAGGEVEFTRLIVGEASVGFAQQSLPGGVETSGVTYAARIHWFLSELLSLSLNAERRFDAEIVTTAAGATSALPISHDIIRLRAEWEPQRRLLIHGQVGHEQESRETAGQTDELTSVAAGATYVLTDSVKVLLGGEVQFGKSDIANDIDRGHVTIGIAAAY